MALDRQTLDMTGARQGELFEHTLQMGDDTVTLANIATMAIETQQFQPYDMPRNRFSQRVALVSASFVFVAALLCFAWWGLSAAGLVSSIAAASLLLTGLFLALLVRTAWLSRKIAEVQDYFRLSIGASDGRTVALVDNRRATLEQVRDVIRRKIDTRDHTTTGRFDLNTDRVDVSGASPGGPSSETRTPARQTRAPAPAAPPAQTPSSEPAKPDATGPDPAGQAPSTSNPDKCGTPPTG